MKNTKLTYEYGDIEVIVDRVKVDEYLTNDSNAMIYRDTYEDNIEFWNRCDGEPDEGNCECFGCSTNFKKLDYCEVLDYREMRDDLKTNIIFEFFITDEETEDLIWEDEIQDDAYGLLETWCNKDEARNLNYNR